jgi:outer membrane protein assembly factor BamE
LETYVAAMRARIFTLAVLLLLAGCSSVPSLLYKIEIQQGNVITQEMVNKLKPGMTRSQVRFALGSPMISDAFHENRWDYLYRFEQRGQLVEQRKLTVFFENDQLVRIDGSFSTPVAFTQPTSPEPSAAAVGPTGPLVEEIKEEKSVSSIPGEPSAAGAIPVPEGISATSDIPVSPGGSASSDMPLSIPSASAASEVPAPVKPLPREVPSPATDTGIKDADQLKE